MVIKVIEIWAKILKSVQLLLSEFWKILYTNEKKNLETLPALHRRTWHNIIIFFIKFNKSYSYMYDHTKSISCDVRFILRRWQFVLAMYMCQTDNHDPLKKMSPSLHKSDLDNRPSQSRSDHKSSDWNYRYLLINISNYSCYDTNSILNNN